MKNPKYYLLIAAAALSLGACSTDDTTTDPVPEKGGQKISFTVAEDSETRTTLAAGDVMRWVPTDWVGIYTVGGNVNNNIKTVADVNQSPVEFIGVLENLVSKGDKFYAYYPYNAEQSTDPASVKLTIPAEQTQTKAGEYNGQSHPLVAVPMEITWEKESYAGRINSARFRLLGAIVEMQIFSSSTGERLRGENIKSVKFVSEEPMAGDFTFDLTGVTVKEELPISGYELKEVTTTLDEPADVPATKEEAALVYLTIAPGTYAGDFVVTTNAAQYTFHLAEAMTFGRAVIKGLPADLAEATQKPLYAETDPIQFDDPAVKEICIAAGWDKNGDTELSYGEAAAVTSIGTKFQGKKSISSFNELQYFTGLKSIGSNAFYNCSSLTSIIIPDGVTSINSTAFAECSKLTSINIPQTVSSIGPKAFYECSSLATFEGKYASTDKRCLIKEGTLLAFAPANLTEYPIPDGVTAIGANAFDGCSGLTSINIPDAVTSIGGSAFYGCTNLMSITIPDKVTSIGYRAFRECSSLTSITIPQSVSSIDGQAFNGCSSLSAFYGKYASADHRCLIQDGTLLAFAPADLTESEYTIPDGVTSIGNYVFEDCSSLTSITIPKGVTSIGSSAFSGCSGLESINIPDGVTLIDYLAFRHCAGLMSITIPESVTTIEDRAFDMCTKLERVYCKPTTPPTLGSSAFSNTPSSMIIYVPTNSVEEYIAAWSAYASQIEEDNSSTED